MSSVTPSDGGGYNYYHKTINDLQDELGKENKRSNQRREEQVNDLEKGYKRNLDKLQEKMEETINNVKENSNEEVSRERDTSKNEVARIKNETYDKYGRYNGNDADQMKDQYGALLRESQARDHQYERDMKLADTSSEHRVQQALAESKANLEKQAQAAHDSATESYSAIYKGQAADFSEFKKDAQDKYEKLNRTRLDEQTHERQQLEKTQSEMKRDFDRRVKALEQSHNVRVEKLDRAYENRVDNATVNLESQQERETNLLRRQISELLDNEQRYSKEKGQGTQDAINEKDNEWRNREAVVIDGFEKQISKLKNQGNESERYYARLNQSNVADKERYYSNLLNKVNLENESARKELEANRSRDLAQADIQMKRDRELTEKATDQRVERVNQERDRLVTNQAKAYQETMLRQRISDEDKITALEKELQAKATSSDTSLISPAAEEIIRKKVAADFEKTFDAEHERSKETIDSIQQSYAGRLHETIDDAQFKETSIRKQNVADRHTERARLLDHIQDIGFQKEVALRGQEYENIRQTNNLNKGYAEILEHQRREFEDHIQTAKNDAVNKITAVRQEADFATRLNYRAFTARQNELIRDYNKKLADQKVSYETAMKETKEQAQKAVQDIDRRSKLELEEQARGYEQKLASTEYTHKERERYITENYQDQLEKVKRSNALLISKKS